jgi:predicted alpha/beta superfamily hydrolase
MRSNIFSIFILVTFFCYASVALSQTEIKSIAHGQLIRHSNFKSNNIAPRNIDVWLPTDYSAHKKYAVLYMQDGQNLFDTTWCTQLRNKMEWQIDENMQALHSTCQMDQCIVIGIWNTKERRPEYFPQQAFETLHDTLKQQIVADIKGVPKSDAYLKFITTELKPFIDSAYSTYTGRKHTFIGGSSMGALVSIYALCQYPKVFGGALCFSTHWVGCPTLRNEQIPKALLNYLQNNLPNAKTHKCYMDRGTVGLDAQYEPWQKQCDNIMQTKGYKNKRYVTITCTGHEHSEKYWSKRFGSAIMFLLGPCKKQRNKN